MTKYITGVTGAIVDITGLSVYTPSVACLSVLSSAAAVAVATQRRADRRRRVYDCPTAARFRQVSGLMSTIGPLVEFDVSVTYKLQQTMLQTHK